MNVHNGIKIEDSSLYRINRECLFLLLGIKNNDELKTLLSNNNYKVYTVGPKNRIIEEPDKKLKIYKQSLISYYSKLKLHHMFLQVEKK